jgi:methylmalonyl-CoA/ethylmalonyl-CoA epimerase
VPTDWRLDHVAIGLARIADGAPFLVGELGGQFLMGGPGPAAFTGAQWSFADGEKIELIEPLGDDGFLHRFLAARGPGIHHVTFKVPDIAAAAARARQFGYEVVGYDDSFPYWKEAFLHPKQAQGIVVQLAEEHPIPPELDTWSGTWTAPVTPPPAEPPARVRALRLVAHDAEAARTQWAGLLGGAADGRDGLAFRWPDSPLAVSVRVDRTPPDGPEVIELTCARRLRLPAGGHPHLGARFTQVD